MVNINQISEEEEIATSGQFRDYVRNKGKAIETIDTEEDCELDKVIVPGSSGGSFSGPHHRKFVESSSGGAKTSLLVDIKGEIAHSLKIKPEILDSAFKGFEASLKELNSYQKDLDKKIIYEIAKRFASFKDFEDNSKVSRESSRTNTLK